MNAIIDVKDVSLHTASVTLQAIKVSGKQMTLAVFRQLPEEDSPTSDADYWGVVRYEFKDCGPWLVFSENGVLKKREKLKRWWFDNERFLSRAKADTRLRDKFGRHNNSPTPAEIDQEVEVAKRKIEAVETDEKLFLALPHLYIAV